MADGDVIAYGIAWVLLVFQQFLAVEIALSLGDDDSPLTRLASGSSVIAYVIPSPGG